MDSRSAAVVLAAPPLSLWLMATRTQAATMRSITSCCTCTTPPIPINIWDSAMAASNPDSSSQKGSRRGGGDASSSADQHLIAANGHACASTSPDLMIAAAHLGKLKTGHMQQHATEEIACHCA